MFLKINKKFTNPDFQGTEANLYIKDDYLYKIYNENNSSINHLMNLINKQDKIEHTILPDNILYNYSGKNELGLVGCRIKYFKDYINLSKIDNSLDERLDILLRIFLPLEELLEHNIYPRDLNNEGILVGDTIQIIDLDTFDTKITEDYDEESYLFVLKLFKVILLKTIYPDFEPINNLYNLEEYLKSKKLKDSLVYDITKDEFDFRSAKNLIYSLKK